MRISDNRKKAREHLAKARRLVAESNLSATVKSTQEQLAKIRRLISRSHSSLTRMTEQQIIQALRKTREELWEEKFAARPR